MSDFDRLYHLTQERNKQWRDLMEDVNSGRFYATRAAQSREVPVVDDCSGATYGFLIVDGNGTIRSMDLDPQEVVRSNEGDVLKAISAAMNSSATRSHQGSYQGEGKNV
ncbi:hypothetical protein NBRGN_110_03640 [Nocardia brasiliensis NBRC 14402]|uniref:hypothetical protein n=1 Tax=Nocardia brasiliensis TaxID=37326 RepID=UPI00045C4D50|nr:hypothetical protein [Nocardia brasiliensis]ASF09378.1 hypothetical protein CEQ30_20705 [Nocardia brasiliensis]GAJ86697.1 hypothetical protein NBRGN_110_03640 [Nocardia brasiliensis NBRC 14402]SUB39928.1 Uncharacterised protein [Nocardia brasiliensis]